MSKTLKDRIYEVVNASEHPDAASLTAALVDTPAYFLGEWLHVVVEFELLGGRQTQEISAQVIAVRDVPAPNRDRRFSWVYDLSTAPPDHDMEEDPRGKLWGVSESQLRYKDPVMVQAVGPEAP